MIPYKQLKLADVFEECQEIFNSDKPRFLSLLENHIDLDSIIPVSFETTTMHQRDVPVNTL
jgi:hypothetical protein